MDMDAFRTDLEKALRTLPPTMFEPIQKIVVDHLPHMATVIPQLLPLIAPHGRALMFELSTGMTSLADLEPIMRDAFGKVSSERIKANAASAR